MTAISTPPAKSIGSLFADSATATIPSESSTQPLSASPLWDRQKQFYRQEPEGIWASGVVPHGITCNPAIAHTYARMTMTFLRGVATDAPVHIVEFGGGTGRFAYLFIRQLRDLLPGGDFTYVLTDFLPERIASWREHALFRPLIAEGLLDFAVLDADAPGPLDLAESGRRLEPGSLDGPVVGVANYVFDSLRHDSYAVRGGVLMEARAQTATEPPGALPEVTWDLSPVAGPDDEIDPILRDYADALDDTMVLVPVGGVACLDYVSELTTGPTCVLAADKGHTSTMELCSHEEPSLVPHGDGFSLMVNFDYLARHVRGRGGLSVLPQDAAMSLVVGAFVEGDVGRRDELAALLQDQLLDTGPDNYFTFRPLLTAGAEVPIETLIAALKLSRYDTTLFLELLPALLDRLPEVPDPTRADVGRVLTRVYENYFPIGEEIDVSLCVGLAFSAMDRCPQAAGYLQESIDANPDNPQAAFAMAICQRGLGDMTAASEMVARALELHPTFSEARALRAVLDAERGV